MCEFRCAECRYEDVAESIDALIGLVDAHREVCGNGRKMA